MRHWMSGVVLTSLTAIVVFAAGIWLTLWHFIPAPPSTITIAAMIKGGPFDPIAHRYRERLARRGITLDIRFFETGAEDLTVIKDKTFGVDAAFLFGGMSNSEESPDLLSLGRINYAPIWVFYRGDETLDRLTQLKGKRINVPPAYKTMTMKILNAHGVNADNTTLSSVAYPIMIKAARDGTLDAAVIPPQEPDTEVVQSLMTAPNFHLMNLSQVETITQLFPTLNHLVLRQGVIDLEKNIPPADVNLLATTSLVAVRKTLHPEIIDILAQTLQEEHGGAGLFQRAGDFPTQVDPEFPMAENARDFYRNGPSFLQRYLPFWMISYTKRIVALWIATIAIIIPVFNYAPKLYTWFLRKYLDRLYRRLRIVENSLQGALSAAQIRTLQADLESIGLAAHILPTRFSTAFFDLIMHIDLTRARLGSRLAGSGE